jgi:hypothetical protein
VREERWGADRTEQTPLVFQTSLKILSLKSFLKAITPAYEFPKGYLLEEVARGDAFPAFQTETNTLLLGATQVFLGAVASRSQGLNDQIENKTVRDSNKRDLDLDQTT